MNDDNQTHEKEWWEDQEEKKEGRKDWRKEKWEEYEEGDMETSVRRAFSLNPGIVFAGFGAVKLDRSLIAP